MKEFRQLLSCLSSVKHTLESLTELKDKNKLKSERLKTLLTCQSQDGLFPEGIEETVNEFN